MAPLHRVRARPSAVGERYAENAFTGAGVAPPRESQIVRDLTKRIETLERSQTAMQLRLAALEAKPVNDLPATSIAPEILNRLAALEARPAIEAPPVEARVHINAEGASEATLAALQEMAAKAVEKMRADLVAKVAAPAGPSPEVQELARAVQDTHGLLEGQIQQLRAVLEVMKDHGPRLGHIEQALGVLHAAASAVATRG